MIFQTPRNPPSPAHQECPGGEYHTAIQNLPCPVQSRGPGRGKYYTAHRRWSYPTSSRGAGAWGTPCRQPQCLSFHGPSSLGEQQDQVRLSVGLNTTPHPIPRSFRGDTSHTRPSRRGQHHTRTNPSNPYSAKLFGSYCITVSYLLLKYYTITDYGAEKSRGQRT